VPDTLTHILLELAVIFLGIGGMLDNKRIKKLEKKLEEFQKLSQKDSDEPK